MSARDAFVTVAIIVTCFGGLILAMLICTSDHRRNQSRKFADDARARENQRARTRAVTCRHPRLIPYSQPMMARTRWRWLCAVCRTPFEDHPHLDRLADEAVERDRRAS